MADADTTTATPAQTADSAQTRTAPGNNTPATPDAADGDQSGVSPPDAAAAAPPAADGSGAAPAGDDTPPPDNSGQDGATPPPDNGQNQNLPPQSTAASLAEGAPLAVGLAARSYRSRLQGAARSAAKTSSALDARLARARATEAAHTNAQARSLRADVKRAGLTDTATPEEVEAATSRRTASMGRRIEGASKRALNLEERASRAAIRSAAAAEAAGGESLLMGGLRRLGPVAALGVAAYDVYHGYRTGGQQGAIRAGEDSAKTLGGAWAGAEAGALVGGAMGSIVPGIGTGIGALIGGVVGGFGGSIYGKKIFDWVVNKGPAFLARHLGDPIKVANRIDDAVSGHRPPPHAPAAPAAAARAAPDASPRGAPPARAVPAATTSGAAKANAGAGASGRTAPASTDDNHGLGHGPHGLIHEHEFEQIPESAKAQLNADQLRTALAHESKSGIYFDFDEASKLTPEGLNALRSQLADIKKAGKIVLIGHTDLVGADAYNNTLSLDRANTIRQALIGMGVNGDDIKIVGVGKQDAADGNNPPVIGRDPLDRRVTWAPDPSANATPAPTNAAATPGTAPGAAGGITPPPNPNGQPLVGVVPLLPLVGVGAFGAGYFGGYFGGGGFDGHHHHEGSKPDCPPGMDGQPKHHWWQRSDDTSRPDRGGLRTATARDASAGIASADAARAQAIASFEAPSRNTSRGNMVSGQNLTFGAGRGGAIGGARFGGGVGGMGHAGGGGHR